MRSYPYAATNIRALENKLINFERALKIAEGDDPWQSFRSLLETGYGGGDATAPEQFETLIERELGNAYAHIQAIMPDPQSLNLFLLKNDYHNLKVLLKLNLSQEKLSEEYLRKNGTIPLKVLIDAVNEKKYTQLTPFMQEALEELDRQFSMKEDVSLIGLYLDNAYGRELGSRLANNKSTFVAEYMRIYADYTNLISLIRIRNMDLGVLALQRSLLPGGVIPDKTFIAAFDAPSDTFVNIFARGIYEKRFITAFEEMKRTGSLFALEKSRDDFLMDTVRKYKNDFMTPAPALGYLLVKEREAENIRVIMSAKLNKLSNDTILSLLKEMF